MCEFHFHLCSQILHNSIFVSNSIFTLSWFHFIFVITEFALKLYSVFDPSSQASTQHIVPSPVWAVAISKPVSHMFIFPSSYYTIKQSSEHTVLSVGDPGLLLSLCFANFKVWYTEAYSELCQTCEINHFWGIGKGFSVVGYFGKLLRLIYLVEFWIHIWIHWTLSRGTVALCLSLLVGTSTHRKRHQFWFSSFNFSTHHL